MSPLHLPPLLVRHLPIPVQVPGGEGDLIRVSISVLDIRVVLLWCLLSWGTLSSLQHLQCRSWLPPKLRQILPNIRFGQIVSCRLGRRDVPWLCVCDSRTWPWRFKGGNKIDIYHSGQYSLLQGSRARPSSVPVLVFLSPGLVFVTVGLLPTEPTLL